MSSKGLALRRRDTQRRFASGAQAMAREVAEHYPAYHHPVQSAPHERIQRVMLAIKSLPRSLGPFERFASACEILRSLE